MIPNLEKWMICTENESKKVVSYNGIKYFVIIRSSTLRLFKNKILTRILTFLIMLTPKSLSYLILITNQIISLPESGS